MFDQARQFLRDNPRLPLVAGLASLIGVLVVWGVWGGFSLDFSRFYAAEPTVCSFVNKNAPECACALNRSVTSACHVCTRSFQEGNTDYSDAQWFAWDNEGLCRPTCPSSFPYLTGRTKRDGTLFEVPFGCVEKPADCPDGYFALTIGGGVTICEQSPPPTPVPTPTPTPTPTPSLAPTPTPTPTASVSPSPTASPTEAPVVFELLCAPAAQTVVVGQVANFQASGGTGVYRWVGGFGSTESGTAGSSSRAAFSWSAPGSRNVTLTSGGQTAFCAVTIAGGIAAPTPIGQADPLGVTKQVRNVTAGQTALREQVQVRADNRIEFVVRIVSRLGIDTGTLSLRDTLPPGMSYMSTTTFVNGVRFADGIVTNGLTLPSLPPGGEHTIRWWALADRVGELQIGAQDVQVGAFIQAAGGLAGSATVDLTVFGTGTGSVGTGPFGGAGQIPTGPGSATVLAFIAAAVGSLLYAAHTRSPAFRRREIQRLGQDQGPMDFRS